MSQPKEQLNGYCKFRDDLGGCANFKVIRASGRPVSNPSVKCRVPEERRERCGVPIITRQQGFNVEIEEKIVETPAA